MCGRYALTTPPELLATLFHALLSVQVRARYNIAPGQAAPVVRAHPGAAPRSIDALWWGLLPAWARDEKIANQTINARSETADTKPAFRAAFRQRRCLVPADGFYEWKQITPKLKQPYFVHRKDNAPIAYAGLWESWRPPDQPRAEPIETFTILTVEPNDVLRSLHDRMPAIVEPADYDTWLDPDLHDPAPLKACLRPFPPSLLDLHPVSPLVNKPAHDQPECVKRVAELTGREDTLFDS